MDGLSDDIFTEPADVDPDTLANLGPLRPMAGIWDHRDRNTLTRIADATPNPLAR
jgi:hypothetical protein